MSTFGKAPRQQPDFLFGFPGQQQPLRPPQPENRGVPFGTVSAPIRNPPFAGKPPPANLFGSSSSVTPQVSQIQGRPNSLLNYSSKPAPANQFKRYVQKTENVNYEDRFEAKVARYLSWLIRFVGLLTGLAVIFYMLVNTVTPYDGPTPLNGYVRNKVLYCDFGYKLVGNECVVDDSFKLEAEDSALGVITELRMEYGDTDCNQEKGTIPSRDIHALIAKSGKLDERERSIIQDQVRRFLSSQNNQRDYKFDYDGTNIFPRERLYSYTCRVQLILQSGTLWKGLIGALAILVLVWQIYGWYLRRELAAQVYQYLKGKAMSKDMVSIKEERDTFEQFGQVDDHIWTLVDRLRTRQQLIGYFQDDDNLYWKRIS